VPTQLDGKLPEEVLKLLSPHIEKDEKILYSQGSDLSPDRRFGESYLVITNTRVAVADPQQDSSVVEVDA